jgi:Flp pilus assembly protein TadD
MQLMREVIQKDPAFSNAYFELGKSQLQQGDVNGAIMSLEKARSLRRSRHTSIINSAVLM